MAERLRALGDETRLRILRVLMEESLNVGELTQVLGLAQPTVSKHLGELKRVGWVKVVRASGFNYYRVERNPTSWWEGISSALARRGNERGDLARLSELLRQRQELSETTDRFVVPGRSWVAWSRALRYLLPEDFRVADFGCGDGAFSAEMAAWAQEVYAIDSNADFLALAQQSCHGLDNVRFLHERMEQLSLAACSVNLVTVSQSLHYAEQPNRVIQEAFRILVSGGRILILDLLPHQEGWVRTELRHHWMGFPARKLCDWLEAAGFSRIECDTETKQTPDPFRIVIVTGRKELG